MNADTTPAQQERPDHRPGQLAMGIAAVVVAALLAYGAAHIPSDAGYAGVGPDFLPWLVAGALGLCGVMLILEVRSGGYRNMEEPSGAPRGDWHALAWVSAGSHPASVEGWLPAAKSATSSGDAAPASNGATASSRNPSCSASRAALTVE